MVRFATANGQKRNLDLDGQFRPQCFSHFEEPCRECTFLIDGDLATLSGKDVGEPSSCRGQPLVRRNDLHLGTGHSVPKALEDQTHATQIS